MPCHVPPPPHGRSPAPALRREERWGRSAPCGGALRRFPALVFAARLTAFLRAAALRARRRWRIARTRRRVQPAVLVVGSLGERRAARGSARCRGRQRGAKKSLFAPGARWLVSTGLALLPGAANVASLKPGRWRSCASSRLVNLEFTRTCTIMAGTCCLCVAAILRVAVVLAASLPVAVKGRCCKTLFLSTFNTLFVSTHVPRGCRGGRSPWRRLAPLASRAGNSRSSPPQGALAPYPKSNSPPFPPPVLGTLDSLLDPFCSPLQVFAAPCGCC